jgi:hypothetical protein
MKKYTSLKISAIVAVLVFVGAAAAFSQTSQMVFNNWASGNAGAECLQVGDFTYAFKMNEGGSEGAPNITETADFYDMDGNFVHTNTITILNSDGKVFDYGDRSKRHWCRNRESRTQVPTYFTITHR